MTRQEKTRHALDALRGVDRMRRPDGYASREETEWDAICATAISDLMRLATEDGCVAAAWAIEMFKANGKDGE